MTGVRGPGTHPSGRRISSGYDPERDIAATTVTLPRDSPFLDRAIPAGRKDARRSDIAPAGLVARVSAGQVLPALEGPAEVAETGHERDQRIEDDTQRR
jgi:hypothetical protein